MERRLKRKRRWLEKARLKVKKNQGMEERNIEEGVKEGQIIINEAKKLIEESKV